MKKLAFAYAGSFDMPSMKMVKIERENIMFANGTVYQHNGSGGFDVRAMDLALDAEIKLASQASPVGSMA